MSFDGIVTRSVTNELNNTILGGRVDKIYQPEKDELIFRIHNKGSNYKLLLSASSNNPRLNLTNSTKENPDSPPMFCMLLRKYLSGGIILNIEQFLLDRIVFIDISSTDELGQKVEKRVIIEIMGRYSNIILVEKDTNKVIDSIKRVTADMSRIRQILPNLQYELPSLGDKEYPLEINREKFMDLISKDSKNKAIYKFFYSNFIGLSPLISREICFNSFIDMDRTINSLSDDDIANLYTNFVDLMNKVEKFDFQPVYIKDKNTNDLLAFYCLDIKQFGNENKIFMDSMSQVLDSSYIDKDLIDRLNQKSQAIRKSINIKLDRALSKVEKLKEELVESQNREKYKIYADLISANLYNIPKGIGSVNLENFYDEDMNEINVPLDLKLSPVENAQRYYKKYSKLKNAEGLLIVQIKETEDESLYLENVLLNIDNSTTVLELDEIKEELSSEGYLRKNKNKKKNKNPKESSPHHFISQDGFHIYVGKNNKQNDNLTLRFAKKDDIWLHVQNMPGSHVIIRTEGQDIPDTTLSEAGLLAAYYSKGKNSSHVPVDFTLKKNVKKPKNAKAGMVIYDNFKTLIIDPVKEEIAKINKVED